MLLIVSLLTGARIYSVAIFSRNYKNDQHAQSENLYAVKETAISKY